jgi:hypothetical protein
MRKIRPLLLLAFLLPLLGTGCSDSNKYSADDLKLQKAMNDALGPQDCQHYSSIVSDSLAAYCDRIRERGSDNYITPTTSSDNYCCKHCVGGQACGDSCISVTETCHKASGCACNAN